MNSRFKCFRTGGIHRCVTRLCTLDRRVDKYCGCRD